jgi:butyryl-CoA dehydrogenase
MAASDEQIIQDTLRAFRKKRIEAEWEKLNGVDADRYNALWQGLAEIGVTLLGVPEDLGGVSLDAASRFEVMHELGAGSPSLALGLISHTAALSLVCEAGAAGLPASLQEAVGASRFALASSLLDGVPDTELSLVKNGTLALSGSQRVMLAHPDFIVVAARDGANLRLCVVRADAQGVSFTPTPSSHGLTLLPFGVLAFDHVSVEHVYSWPASGRAAAAADGLLTATLCGMLSELCERPMRYALERYQGGKMIHEHDAVRQLVGAHELSRRPLRALALATLAGEPTADGCASAFAVELVRRAGLDSIQTFGGYGYMEDYRVERYLRDANTIETFFVHAAARQRQLAKQRFAELAR